MIFDILILFGILFCCVSLYNIWFIKNPTKKDFNQQRKKTYYNVVSLILIVLLFVLWYGSFIEPKRLIISHTDIQLENEKNTKIAEIALVTDLHVGHFKKQSYIEKLVKNLKEVSPDIIFLGGDFLSGNPQAAFYLEPFKELAEEKQIYAVWGNHDFHVGSFSDEPRDDTEFARIVFEETGIILLENDNVLIKNEPEDFWLMGVDSVLAKRSDFAQSYHGISPEDQRAKIVLAHNPDVMFSITEYYTPIDIILTGHTHGGQIRLPIIGPVPTLPIYLGQTYDKNLFDYKGYKLFISSGVGETGTRARLFNPPEISIVNIWK